MESTLQNGDVVIIEKLSYGPKVPNDLSEVPFGSLFFKPKSNPKNTVKRMSGLDSVERHDIIVFKRKRNGQSFIKRIIGLPNDSLKIVNSSVIINNNSIEELDSYIYEYSFLDDLTKKKTLRLSNKKYQEFDKKHTLKKIINPKKSVVESIFPKEKMFEWNTDNYGSIWIPGKGKTINLSKDNIIFYREIIEDETGHKLSYDKTHDKYYLNENQILEYTFLQDYYFVMGDNRNFSNDSRFFGFIGKKMFTGKFFLKF